MAPHRSGPFPCFPSFFFAKPRTVRVGPVPVAQVRANAQVRTSAHLWTSAQGFEVCFPCLGPCFFCSVCRSVFVLSCFFPYLFVHVVPRVCLLSHMNVFLSRLCFFVPSTFVNVLPCFFFSRGSKSIWRSIVHIRITHVGCLQFLTAASRLFFFSLDAGLQVDSLPALQFWECVLATLSSNPAKGKLSISDPYLIIHISRRVFSSN